MHSICRPVKGILHIIMLQPVSLASIPATLASRNTVGTGRPLSKAKGNANIVGSLTKRVHALRGVETAIYAGGKITLLVCVHKQTSRCVTDRRD